MIDKVMMVVLVLAFLTIHTSQSTFDAFFSN